MLFSIVETTARLGIGIGPAADDGQGGRPGEQPLDFIARIAGPLGTDLVEFTAQGRAVAGVAKEHRPDFARIRRWLSERAGSGRRARWG